ncbi:PREDICTED: protein sidekick isoform X2 [Papilio xuthus]|uniref:Hemolin n=1 Tax=Papilio xuthus TaxID=66420 RepID=A0AAJ6ZYV1_PAPXU|nr:PREDICTED: protein sidekick isoform X1 [Papilio xuthus]XP_013182227.1 PREDICTED: protein sidekick isoform X2 [Papilio xuthus]
MEELERLLKMYSRKFLGFLLTTYFLIQIVTASETSAQMQPPRFNMQPSSLNSIVREGTSKILQCSAVGIPQPMYRWLKNGVPLSEYSTDIFYKIHNTQRQDAGAYQCIAKNDVGAIFSEKNNIVVAYMGVFENQIVQEVTVDSGRAAILDFPHIDSEPPPSVNWQDENGELRYDQKYAVTDDHKLVILCASKKDERSYRAQAFNTQSGKVENSPFIKLNVLGDDNKEIAPEIIIKPQDTKIIKGQEYRNLYCIANARPLHELETLWFKDGILIDIAGITYDLNDQWNRTLSLISANLTHTGQYTCQARLKSGGFATVTASATVTVFEKPTMLSTLKSETYGEFGSTVVLECNVEGIPLPGITWYKDAKKIASVGAEAGETDNGDVDDGGGRYRVELDRSLIINDLKMEDMGIYQCIASNEAGEASINTWLKIKTSPPVMQSVPTNLTVLDGKDATISCRAIGAPTPNVTWYFNDSLIIKLSGRLQALDEGDLLITSTTTADSGKYTCIRANDAGNVSGEAYLTVLVRTQIIAPPVDTRVLLGHTATLQCRVSSDPNVKYNIDWFHNNQPMTAGSRVWITNEGALQVQAVRASDAGEYACVVTSPGGNHTRRALLSVIELPFAPTNVRALRLDATQRAVNVSWTPGFDGNSPVHKFIVQRRVVPEFGPTPDPLLNWVTEPMNVSASQRWVLLTSLKAATSYQFRVSAVNTVGEGPPSDPTDVLTLPQEAPSGPPLGFMGSARSSSEIITQWQPPLEEHRNGHILGYVIRYRLRGYDNSPWTYQNITNEAQRNYLIQDLITWKDYNVQIAAYNDKGVGVFSESYPIKTKEGVPEAAPDSVRCEAFNSTAITVWWTPPNPQKINGINQGYKIQAWRWEASENGNVEQKIVSIPPNLLDPLTEQAAIIAGLDKFTEYNISVLCFTEPGDGPKSDYVLVRTKEDIPDEVGGLQFDDISDRAVRVSWSPPKKANGVLIGYKLSYQVKDNNETYKEEILPPNITSIRVEHLQASTQYVVWVSALSGVGEGPARGAGLQSGVEPVLPAAPRNLALSNIAADSVLLQFTPGFDGNSSISLWTVQAQTARNTSWVTIYEVSEPDAQSILVTGLVPFTTYRLRLVASNVVGSSPPSEPCKEFQTIQAPPRHPPRNVTVRAVSANNLRVRWIPLQQSEWYGNPKGYNITYKRSGDNETLHCVIEDHTANSHVLANLEEWSLYEVRMTALNEVGVSAESPTALERTREAVPSSGPVNVSANATSSTTIVVLWGDIPVQDQNGLIEGYKVCYAAIVPPPRPEHHKVECQAIPSNQTHTVTLTELRKYVIYQIQVLGYTRLGDGALSDPPVTVRTFEDTPGPPSNVSFPDVTFTMARIIWDVPEDPNGEILAYKVTYHLNSSTQHMFSKEFLPSDRTFRATELLQERYYLFSVTAQTRLGWGGTARALVLTTANRAAPAPPARPNLQRSLLQPHHITFSWTPGDDGYAPLRYYTVQQKEEGGTWQTLPERVDPFATSYTVDGLKPYTGYQFRIRATNDIGPSRYSNATEMVRTLPAAPSKAVEQLRVVPITPSSVRVQWAPLAEAHWSGDTAHGGYRVSYQPLTDFPTSLQHTMKQDVQGIKSEEVVLTDLAVDRNYEISVCAVNAQGAGPGGTPAVVWVGEAVPTAPPRDVTANALSPTEVALTWQPPALAQQNGDLLGYKIFYLMTDSPEEPEPGRRVEEEIEVVPATATSHSLVFLDKYTQYRIQVLAFNPAGDGPRSSALQVRTEQGLPSAPRNISFTDITMNSLVVAWLPPRRRNGPIQSYLVTYETIEQDERFSKQVKQKVTEERLAVGGLEEEVEYRFCVRAVTVGAGGAAEARVRTGPQPGSPAPPRTLRLRPDPAALHLRWDNAASGRGPLLGYYIEARKKDDTRWETITRTSNGMLEEFTVSYQSLLPSTAYSFRVIAYNAYGISAPAGSDKVIVTPSKLYLEYGYLQYRPFYRRTWFMVALAAASLVVIIMVVAILCVKSKTYKYKKEAQKTLEESLAGETDERGSLAMELYRSRQSSVASAGGGGAGGAAGAGTLRRKPPAALGKAPPRPSPASVAYHSDEESLRAYDENPDDSSLTEKPSEMSSSDSQNSESENESVRSEPHSFVNHYANVNDTLRQSWKRQRPVRNYSSYTDSEPEGSAVLSLNGGQIVMNNMARSRAPLPGFSSFV